MSGEKETFEENVAESLYECKKKVEDAKVASMPVVQPITHYNNCTVNVYSAMPQPYLTPVYNYAA